MVDGRSHHCRYSRAFIYQTSPQSAGGRHFGSSPDRADFEQTYSETRRGTYVTGPPVNGKGKVGPSFPIDENPHDLVFS
jgi:hypothetical protein